MTMGRVGWWGVGLLVAATVGVGGCALEDQHHPFFHDKDSEAPELSSARLGDSWEDDSVSDFLTADERQALRHSGTSALRADDLDDDLGEGERAEAEEPLPKEPQGAVSRALDKAGKVAVSALGVGISVGMVVAPYFLF